MTPVFFAVALLLIAFAIDVRRHKIPNWLTASFTAAGFILHMSERGWAGTVYAGIGLLCGFVPMLLLYGLRAVGAGDVKLFGALGCIMGTINVLSTLFSTLIFAGLLACIILFWRSDRLVRLRQLSWILMRIVLFREADAWKLLSTSEGALRFPLMWAVLPGALTVYFTGPILLG